MNQASMDDNEYFPLGLLDGIEVGVQPTLDGQDILIRHSDLGQRLACLLAFGRTDIVRREEATYWRIARDRQVDGLLVELIDLLISIRYAHPAMVQLEMILEPAEPCSHHSRHPTSTPRCPSPTLRSMTPSS